MSRVKVIINKKGYIPGLGQGPIRRPILITEELCKQLLALGYPIKVIAAPQVKPVIKKEEISPVILPENTDIVSAEKGTQTTSQVDETPAKEEIVTEEEKVDNSTEQEVEEVEEILENDPDLSPGAYYTEDFLSSKNLCKKILSGRNIQYAKDASFALLRQLVLDSNPEVEIVEEEASE